MRDSIDAHPPAPEPPGLYATLAARARRTSDGTLALMAGAGVIAMVALAIVRPGWWALAMPLIAVGAFDAWGIVDRERNELSATADARSGRALAALQWAAVAAGTVAALIPVFALLGVLLGTIMS